MKSVALCGSRLTWPICESQVQVNIWGRPLTIGLVESQEPSLDSGDPKHANKALIEIQAFSCNYRDKSLILSFDTLCREDSFLCFGCEFAARVLEVGSQVKQPKPGDRVMGNGSYPESGEAGVSPGIPTNHASKRRLILPASRLLKIPDQLSDEVAACFQVGAQTAYSMVRRLNLEPGQKVLVTAARSNTSLAALHALAQLPVEVYALTTSQDLTLEWPVVSGGLLRLSKGSLLKDNAELTGLGAFDAVIDPYFDLYMHQVLPLLRSQGKYITCGCYRQADEFGPDHAEGSQILRIGMAAVTGNLQILGNCLGQTSDLQNALDDYQIGRFAVTMDSVHCADQIGDFFHRTFNAPERFGKVAYKYVS